VLNNTQKYVASTTLKEPLAWSNSTLLKGDVPEAVAGLKAQPGKDFLVMGSGELVQTLMKHNLVDLYILLIHPLVLDRAPSLHRRRCNRHSPARRCQDDTHRRGGRDLPAGGVDGGEDFNLCVTLQPWARTGPGTDGKPRFK